MVGMSLTSCLFRRRHPAKKTIVMKIPLVNKNMIYLEFGLQERDTGREGNYTNYTDYLLYFSYKYYPKYINYFTGSR